MTEKYTDEKTIPAIHSLSDLIEHLKLVFKSDSVNVDYVKAVLAAYKSNPKDWKQYAIFDPYRYTRNLVDTGNDKYNLMALCWGEGHASSVHDHSGSHCFVKVLDGDLKETMFDWPDTSPTENKDHDQEVIGEQLTETAVNHYPKDGVTYINDSMGLHRVENPSHANPAVSLHLYSPPFESCQNFDQRTGKARTIKMVFWSKYGKRTSALSSVLTTQN